MPNQQGRVTVELARHAGDLHRHLPAWRRLVRQSLEPNVFYEPEPLLAALENQLRDEPLAIALVHATAPFGTTEAVTLIGLFPFYLARGGPFRLLRYYRLYTHFHCYLCNPLVDRGSAKLAIYGLLDWIDSRPDGVSLFHFGEMIEDGETADVWRLCLSARGQPNIFYNRIKRAFFRPADDVGSYLGSAMSSKRRKEYRRLGKRLADLGKIEFEVARKLEDPARWIENFIRLEEKGWKGRSGTALAKTPNHRLFFRQMIERLNAAGQLLVLSLTLDGRPIAMKCNLLAGGDGSFAYKVTFDEGFAKYSPGVLLEIENIRTLHDLVPQIRWMDSCARPDHSMINHLWNDSLNIVNLACGSRGFFNRIFIEVIALCKLLSRRLA